MSTSTVLVPAASGAGLIRWALRLVAAVLMLQSLFFKFSGAAESVYIFSTLGVEPWGRIGTGVMELIASLLILWPRTTGLGALMGAGIMGGALLSHAFVLGWEIMGDGGQLVIYAILILLACLILLAIFRQQVFALLPVKWRPEI
ncbi:MAG: DoxX family protein [Chitinophagaceae bacterium]|jgi:uncharacterized membrane protein YphA (DoxX/SURF4 family)|nr:DoxX family protein [Chitinophagaceae bacterium]